MPMYDFMCGECGKEMRGVIMSIKDYEKPKCPKCDAEMQHVLAPVAFILKGTDWTPKFHERGNK